MIMRLSTPTPAVRRWLGLGGAAVIGALVASLVWALVLLGSPAPAPVAAAPSADQVYLGKLAAGGITVSDAAPYIRTAHLICQQLSRGQTELTVTLKMETDQGAELWGQLTMADTKALFDAATLTYCPDYADYTGPAPMSS
jgi:hypothetical protein